MRRIRSRCCARAASGHAAVTLPSSVMNERRFMSSTQISAYLPSFQISPAALPSRGADRCPYEGAEYLQNLAFDLDGQAKEVHR